MSREPKEVQEALQTVSQALAPLKEHKTVTWLLDSGFDDVAVWRTIWEQQEHVVSRIYHTERKVAFQDRQGQWQEGDIAQARTHLRPLAQAETTMEVKRGKQVRPKKQPVKVQLSACPLRLTYQTNVRPCHARRVAGGGACAGHRLGSVAEASRLAGPGRAKCAAHLYDVSPTLECGGQF